MIKMMDDDDYDAFHNDHHLGNNVWTVVLQLWTTFVIVQKLQLGKFTKW